jgi:ubiquinone/menaquinone biosynthesis C-methylase UbiE
MSGGALALACALLSTLALEKDPNEKYLRPDLDVDRWSKAFESRGREIYDKRAAIVAAVGLKAGQALADVGAGTGLFTMLFARGGAERVYAVDIAPRFLAHIKSRAAAAGLKNVVAVRGTDTSIEVPPASVDVVFICDTYHHFEKPGLVLASVKKALRPGGALVIVDFKLEPGKTEKWILEHVRAGQAQVTREVTAAGFAAPEVVPVLAQSYFLRFRVAP